MFDTLEHFYFPKANARGSAIRLQETWQTILERRAYPEPVQRLLGEMTAGAAMLAGSITARCCSRSRVTARCVSRWWK